MILNIEQTKQWMNLFFDKIDENKDLLNQLDTEIGDGDHGTNMARGVGEARAQVEKQNPEGVADLYNVVAFALINKVGGASGPLYGTAFLDMSKSARNGDIELDTLVTVGTDGIKRRGQSDVEMKTMIDVWQPVSVALTKDDLSQATIDTAVDHTKDIVARKGRASYLEEKSVGHIDPGAKSSALLFEALLEVI